MTSINKEKVLRSLKKSLSNIKRSRDILLASVDAQISSQKVFEGKIEILNKKPKIEEIQEKIKKFESLNF